MQRLVLLERFGCLGGACPDTCCRGWDMQVDAPHLALYRAERPELAAAVDTSGPRPVMRRTGPEGPCVKFAGGLCSVHAAEGTQFLGDACHFYPRIVRRLGGETRMSATLSCPEIARLALFSERPFEWSPSDLDREPAEVRDVGTGDGAHHVHQTLLDIAADETTPPATALRIIVSIARSLTRIPPASWGASIAVLARMAPGGLCPAEPDDDDDIRLLHALVGLIHASRHRPGERLLETVTTMADGLGVRIEWQTLNPWAGEGLERCRERLAAARADDDLATILRPWLLAQLVAADFPFAGLGDTPADRVSLLSARFATLALALHAHRATRGALDQDTTVRIVQSLARFLDHLAEPMLSLSLYKDAGWGREARLAGLIARAAGSTRQILPGAAELAGPSRKGGELSPWNQGISTNGTGIANSPATRQQSGA